MLGLICGLFGDDDIAYYIVYDIIYDIKIILYMISYPISCLIYLTFFVRYCEVPVGGTPAIPSHTCTEALSQLRRRQIQDRTVGPVAGYSRSTNGCGATDERFHGM
jgi:hypothetical protein